MSAFIVRYSLIIALMKRLLLILLLIALPFQVSWAAVGGYCQSGQSGQGERIGASRHFGHHQHAKPIQQTQKIQQIQAASDTISDKAPAPGDGDECGFCHLSCTKFLTVVAPLPAAIPDSVSFSPSVSRIYISPTISPVDDPDWMRAA